MRGPANCHLDGVLGFPGTKKHVRLVLFRRIVRFEPRSKNSETPVEALRASAAMCMKCTLFPHAGAADGIADMRFSTMLSNALHHFGLGQPFVGVADRRGVRSHKRQQPIEFRKPNPNGAAALRRSGQGGVALRATVAANADNFAGDLSPILRDIRSRGHHSLRAIAAELNARGMRTRRGGRWQVSNVRNLLRRIGD